VNENPSKSHAGTVTAGILAVVLIYFAFPVIVYVPLFAWYHGSVVPRRAYDWFAVLADPAENVCERSAVYSRVVYEEYLFLLRVFSISDIR